MSDLLLYMNIFNLALSWGLCILIWLVQTIIYPGLIRIPSEDFVSYHSWYVVRITAIVFPLMIGEAIVTIVWIVIDDASIVSIIAACFVVIIWLSTFVLQVPIHKRLQSGKDDILIRRLVGTNWIRTIVWSLRAVVVTVAAVQGI